MTRARHVDPQELIADGRLRIQRLDRHALEEVIAAARADLVAARAMAAISPGWTEAILYEAGLRCARVIVQAQGFRISADKGQQTAIDAANAFSRARALPG